MAPLYKVRSHIRLVPYGWDITVYSAIYLFVFLCKMHKFDRAVYSTKLIASSGLEISEGTVLLSEGYCTVQ